MQSADCMQFSLYKRLEHPEILESTGDVGCLELIPWGYWRITAYILEYHYSISAIIMKKFIDKRQA